MRSLGVAEVLSCCPALEQEVPRTTSGLPNVKMLVILIYSGTPRVPANHDIDLFSEIFQIFLHFLGLW